MIRKIKQASVIGSGVMGGGIAALLASAGVKTLLLDIVPFDLKDEEKTNPAARNRIVTSGLQNIIKSAPPLLMHPRDAERIAIGNLEDDFDRLSQCDWIVEVVVEHLKVKRQLFERIEKVKKPGAIVSSNTSGIPLKKMSEGLSPEFRRHFLGTHFFNPVRYMKLLEIIPGEETLPEVLEYMADFGERVLGKGIVRAKDTPNFVGNRIGIQGIVKSMNLMAKHGLTVPEADALFGPVLGRPKTGLFKTTDLVGLDILAHVSKNTYDLVPDDEQRESFILPEFIGQMLKKNLLGKKTGGGFYADEKAPDGKKIRRVLNLKTLEYEVPPQPEFPCLAAAAKARSLPEKMRAVMYGDDRGAAFAWESMAWALIYAANRVPEISDTIVDIDNAMKWGYNFEMGPFETWDAIGPEESVRRMKAQGLPVPEKVVNMLETGHTSFYKIQDGQTWYYDFVTGDYAPVKAGGTTISLALLKAGGRTVQTCKSASLVDLGEGVFCCEFHTKMNAINGEIVDFIAGALDYVEANGAGLVIGNQAGGTPGAFSAGGDLFMMAGLAMKGLFAEMDGFLKKAQDGLQRARYASFPVVAAPYGLTLGGGCEMCLAADRIVAHAELYMGLVEAGVGLLPAAGGCLNLWKKFLSSIPESVAAPDLSAYFVPAFQAVATAKVSSSAADARTLGFLGPQDRIVFNRDHLIGEAKKEVLKMAAEGYAPAVKRKIRVAGQAAQGMIHAELFNMQSGGFISEYDVFLAKRIAAVISGGDVKKNTEIDEDVILKLERAAFVDFWRQPKTHARVEHMLKTGKPLRN
jgi:3-hydroxyacyl-CoA dehydrogenase